ncbi:baseplate J/gp47 family protein [Enterobacter roggenkampii]|uniref:hypothetical protein n=1 Tax=Enterobacter roggenkampii TaxID=1812935 RepID=UPI002DB56696|nr:hypothetical protein [Enterobacter roggenkampii]MEB5890002.1 hypothetical protein [Enterobacter roggenkampii]
MNEFSALQEKLIRLAAAPGFLLDDRTVQQKLTFLKNYTSCIPFDQHSQTNWDSLLFPAGWPAEKLAEIYEQPERAEGALPPLQAFVLAFLRLLETPQALLNTFPGSHRELYYRRQLGLSEKLAQPSRVALSMQLTTETPELMIPAGLRFSAGQDRQGTPVYYQLDNNILACQVQLSAMYWINQDAKRTWYKRIVCGPDSSPAFPQKGVLLMDVSGSDSPMTGQEKAHLALGFTGIQPGQTLSLFWDLKSPGAFDVRWQYQKTATGWAELKTVSRDDTQRLLTSGLWQAAIPDDAICDEHNCYWLRAEFSEEEKSWPYVNGLLVNAMTATLCDVEQLDPDILNHPLPGGAISQPASRQKGLAGVLQPFSSFSGRPAETTGEFFIRTSQRLSHRNRALSWKDISQLLKTQFPSVFEVIPPPVDGMTLLPAPEQQSLVVLPRPESRDNDDALRPRFSAWHLQEMQDWLARHTSCWQNISVENPEYKMVDVRMKVKWHQGVNPDYAFGQLKNRLIRHYMPWSQGEGNALVTGSQLDYFDFIARIQDDPDVSQVISLSLNEKAESVSGTDKQVLILYFKKGAL